MRDPVYSDSVATSGGPHGLEFLGTGGQGARDMVPVARIRQSVLSWESLECTRVHSLKSFTMGMGWQCALHTAFPAPQSHKLNSWSHSVGHSLVSGHPLQQWAAAIRSNLGLTIQAVPLLVRPSHESMEGSPLTVAAPRSFQGGSVRGGVIFSCSLQFPGL